MMPTRSQIRCASSRLWVFRNMVRFSFLSSRMTSRTILAASGSRFAVGSSRKSRIGSCTSARAMATFCFIPLE